MLSEQWTCLNINPERALSGATIVITRTREQSAGLTRLLEEAGATVISMPLIEIRDPKSWQGFDEAISRLDQYHWLVFTSSNAVRYFANRARDLGSNLGNLNAKIASVGSATRAALKKEGLRSALQASESTSEALANDLLENLDSTHNQRNLIPGSDLSSSEPWRKLSNAGVKIDLVEVYRNTISDITPDQIRSVLRKARDGYILFASPSSIVNLSNAFEVTDLGPFLAAVKVICIGPTTAKAAKKLGLTKLLQPEAPEDSSILNLICDDVNARI